MSTRRVSKVTTSRFHVSAANIKHSVTTVRVLSVGI